MKYTLILVLIVIVLNLFSAGMSAPVADISVPAVDLLTRIRRSRGGGYHHGGGHHGGGWGHGGGYGGGYGGHHGGGGWPHTGGGWGHGGGYNGGYGGGHHHGHGWNRG